MLDLASGVEPRWSRGQGSYAFAASCVLRTFEDMVVRSLPGGKTIRDVEALFPGCRIELFGQEGRPLSEEMQDGHSYRYACINLGGSDLMISSFSDAGYLIRRCPHPRPCFF